MNPELQNYIRVARAAGKSNEVMTRELATGGWTPQDISQALAMSPVVPTPPRVPPPPSTLVTPYAAPTNSFIPSFNTMPPSSTAAKKSGATAKALTSIIIFLILLGAAGYYFILNKPVTDNGITIDDIQNSTPNSEPTPETTPVAATTPPMAAANLGNETCQSVLSVSQFSSITGIPSSSVTKDTTSENHLDVNHLDCEYASTAGVSGGGLDFEVWANQADHNVNKNILGCTSSGGSSVCRTAASSPGVSLRTMVDGTNTVDGSDVIQGATTAGGYDFSCTYHSPTKAGEKPVDPGLLNADAAVGQCLTDIQQNLQ